MEVTGALIKVMWIIGLLTLVASVVLGGILRHNIRRFSINENDTWVIMSVYIGMTVFLDVIMFAALPIL